MPPEQRFAAAVAAALCRAAADDIQRQAKNSRNDRARHRATEGSRTVTNIGSVSPQRTPPYSLAPDKIEFGRQCTPNFVVSEYRDGKWGEPRIEALHHFALHPASNVFQYGQAIFEGLKAYRHP